MPVSHEDLSSFSRESNWLDIGAFLSRAESGREWVETWSTFGQFITDASETIGVKKPYLYRYLRNFQFLEGLNYLSKDQIPSWAYGLREKPIDMWRRYYEIDPDAATECAEDVLDGSLTYRALYSLYLSAKENGVGGFLDLCRGAIENEYLWGEENSEGASTLFQHHHAPFDFSLKDERADTAFYCKEILASSDVLPLLRLLSYDGTFFDAVWILTAHKSDCVTQLINVLEADDLGWVGVAVVQSLAKLSVMEVFRNPVGTPTPDRRQKPNQKFGPAPNL